VTRSLLAAMALCSSIGFASAADDERCKVTDPTGTPLNVRESPNGKIIGTLPNGSTVAIVAEKNAANGKPWPKSSITPPGSRSAGCSASSCSASERLPKFRWPRGG